MDSLAWAGERLIMCRDRELGARALIAIDDTTLGPGLGGVRFASYPSEQRAAEESVRLAAAMTLKNAAAALPYGGAKSVILRTAEPIDRGTLMRWFAARVAELGGAYIPGVDVGTTTDDLSLIAGIAPAVACSEEDPSPWTALGVLAGIAAAVEHRGAALADLRVVVQGAGHVGAELARLLRADGAEVLIADLDTERALAVADRIGATAIDAGGAVEADCDVFAPCAMARVISAENIDRLRCSIVAGAANDTLATGTVAAALADRQILYVPDFLINAGGVIQIHGLREGWPQERLREEVLRIGDRVRAALEDAETSGGTPVAAAEAAASEVLDRKRLQLAGSVS